MTYCIGWQTTQAVFLIADSAVTSHDPLSGSHTSFGETHVREKRRGTEISIEERALKIFRWKHFAVTCSGDASAIQKFAHLLNQRTEIGDLPFDAFGNAIATVTEPGRRPEFQALMATNLDGQPKLFAFNKNDSATTIEVHGIVHLGQAAASHRELVEGSAHFIERNYAEPEKRLACMLAVCQSFTVNDVVLQSGYGGAFSGAYVDESGAHWPPDLAYQVVSTDAMLDGNQDPSNGEHFVACMIRDDVLLVRSTATGGTTAFIATREPLESEEIVRKANAAAKQLARPLENLEFGFLTLYAKGRPVSAIVEMRGAAQTRHLGLRTISPPDIARHHKIAWGISKEVYDFLTDKTYPVDRRIFRLFERD